METSIVELEKRMTYLEKYVEELNEVIVDQQRQLNSCQKELSRLRPKGEPSPIGEDRPHDEKPPHY